MLFVVMGDHSRLNHTSLYANEQSSNYYAIRNRQEDDAVLAS